MLNQGQLNLEGSACSAHLNGANPLTAALQNVFAPIYNLHEVDNHDLAPEVCRQDDNKSSTPSLAGIYAEQSVPSCSHAHL